MVRTEPIIDWVRITAEVLPLNRLKQITSSCRTPVRVHLQGRLVRTVKNEMLWQLRKVVKKIEGQFAIKNCYKIIQS